MDFYGLKRKELQELCKKHGIPANLKNLEMADRLSSLLKVENPKTKGRSCLKNLSVVSDDEVFESKEPKRVKFSPQNETFVFEKTDPRELRIMARKKRAFGKSKMEENPVVVGGIVDGDVDNENVDDLEKPGKRTSRRKSVVPDPIAVSDTENSAQVNKPVKRVSRRKSVVPDPVAVSETENVVQVDKPVKRVSRRQSVVPDSVAVSDIENAVQMDKPVTRGSRRKSVVLDPVAVSETENVVQVDKPVKRVSRRQSVVPDSVAISDIENAVQVDKPVTRVSRRKSVVLDPVAVSDTENVVQVDKPIRRVSRQKSVVADSIVVSDTENAVQVDKPVKRVPRPKFVMPAPVAVSDTENVQVDKPVRRVSRRMPVVVNSNVEDTEIVDKVHLPVKGGSRQKSVVGKRNIVVDTEVVDEVEKPAGRILRRRAYKDKADEVLSSKVVDNVDTDISVKLDEPVQRTSKRKCVLTKQNAVLDTEIVNNVEKPAKRILRSVVVQSSVDKSEKPTPMGKKDHVEDVPLSPCAVNKVKQSSKVQEKVGRGAVEEVDRPPAELVGLVGENNKVNEWLSGTEMVADVLENGDDGFQADRGQVRRIEEVSDQAIDEKNAQGKSPDMAANIKVPKLHEKKAENCIEAAGLIPNSSEKPFTMQSDDCLEEINIKDKAPETELAAFDTPKDNGSLKTQNSGEHAAENSMQANKVKEKQETSSHQNIVADKISDEGHSSTPHSLWKINISGTLCGYNMEKTCAAGETTCSSALKSSILGGSEVDDAGKKQSRSLAEMRDTGIFGSTEGLECYHQIKNEELVGQENGCEGSPCLSNSFKIENTAVEGKIDCAAMIFETSDVKSTKQEGTGGSKIDCAALIFEVSDIESTKHEGTDGSEGSKIDCADVDFETSDVKSTKQEGTDGSKGSKIDCAAVIFETSDVKSTKQERADGSKGSKIDCAAVNFETSDIKSTKQEGTDGSKGSRDIISEENVVFGSKAIMENDVPPPIVVDGMTYASNASAATNKIVEEAKDNYIVTPLGNQRTNSSVGDAKDSCLFQSLNKDDNEGRTEPSSINTFLMHLESQVDDAMRVLLGSMSEGEECDQETFRGDIACDANSTRVKNLTEVGSPVILEQVNETYIELEGGGNDLINYGEGKEIKYEKAIRVMEQDAFGSLNGGETPVVFQERKWAQVAGRRNISPLDMAEDMKSSSNSDHANPVNFKEREVSDTSHLEPSVSSLDVGNICIEVSEQIPASDPIPTENDQKMKEDDKSSDQNTISKETLHSLKNLGSNFVAPSCSTAQESQTGTPSGGLTCSVNDANLECAADDRECITAIQPEEAHCSNESKSEHLVSEEDINDCAQSKDQQFEMVTLHKEEITIFDNLAAQPYSVAKEVETLAPETGHIEEAEGASTPKNESPKSITCNELDEVLGTEFDWQTKSAGSIKKEFKNDPQQVGTVEGVKKVANLNEKENSKTNSGSEFGVTVESGLASQGGLTCSANHANLECAADGRECITAIQPEESHCSSESKSEHLVSEEDINDCAQSKDQQFEMVTLHKEEITIFDNLATQAYSVTKEVETLAPETGHIEEAEGASTPGNESPKFITCNELDEVLGTEFDWKTKSAGSIKEQFKNDPQQVGTVEGAKKVANLNEKENSKTNSGSEFGVTVERGLASQGGFICSANDAHLECAADGRGCITVMQPEEAHCSSDSNSELLVSEEDINDSAQSKDQQFEMVTLPEEEITLCDNLAAQAYSVAKDVDSLAPETRHIEEAEGASTPGNESLESITCNELDEVLGTEFDWQTKSAGSIKKKFKNDPQQVGTGFGVTEDSGLASQSSFLIIIPEESESGYGHQIAKVCLMEDTDQGHIAGNGNAINSCVGQLEMAERSDSLKDLGNFLLENVASEIDNNTRSIVVACPPMDRSPCYFANVNTSMCEIASGSLQEKKCHKTLQNASIGNIEVLCSSEPMLLEDNKGIKGDMVETGVEISDALPSESSMHDEIVPQTSVSKMHCESESIAGEKEIEFSSTKEVELQDICKQDNTEGNCVSSILMVDPLSSGKNDKEAREVEGAVNYVSEEQTDSHMNAGNVKDQESIYDDDIGCEMEAMEEDTCAKGIDNSAPSRSEILDCLPYDINEVSDVVTNIVHETSMNSDAELEFNVNEGNRMLGNKVSDGELVDGKIDCMAEEDHPELKERSDNGERSTIPKHIVFRESPVLNVVVAAYKDDTQELDSAKSPYSRDAEDDQGCSVISQEKQAYILPMISEPNCSDSLIPIDNTLGSNKNKGFVKVAGVHEMVQEASSDNPFILLEQETDDMNSEPHSEDGGDDVIHAGRVPNSPAICEINEVNDSSKENALSHPTEEHDTFAVEDFTKPPERQIGSNLNDYDASDNRTETNSSSPRVPENFIDQLQQQNNSPLMPSYQQADPSGSACQSDTTATAILDNGDMKSNSEYFLFTDSEIDLLFGEMEEKDEVRTLQTEASGAVLSVNEYEIAKLEDDSARQERVKESVEENEKWCPFDTYNLGKVVEKNKDLDSDDKVLMSSMIRRKNTRSIMIHGTPTKPSLFVHDMKENPPAQKMLQTVNATALKPNVKRKALGDIAK